MYHNFRNSIKRDDNTFFGLEFELIDEDFDSFVTRRRQKQKAFELKVKQGRKQDRFKKNKALNKPSAESLKRAYADFGQTTQTFLYLPGYINTNTVALSYGG